MSSMHDSIEKCVNNKTEHERASESEWVRETNKSFSNDVIVWAVTSPPSQWWSWW